MPAFLVVAIAAGVAFAAFSTSASRPPVASVPAPPLTGAPENEAEEPTDPDQPEDLNATPPRPAEETLTGIVREHMDVAQYTYVRLASDAGETWAAVYRAPVKDGKSITLVHASALKNFHSRELGRDFDVIYFGVLPGFETAPGASAAALGRGVTPATDIAPGALKTVAGAMTVADLARNAASLVGTKVTVVGRVSKETDAILDRNWIHIVDGTGNAKDGTNDLLVTSAATSGIGDDVVATGTVRTNQDFGSGYAYKFLLEKATVTPATK
jgi:hypothetical protein